MTKNSEKHAFKTCNFWHFWSPYGENQNTPRVVDCPRGLCVQNAYPVCMVQLESNLAMSFETRFHA